MIWVVTADDRGKTYKSVEVLVEAPLLGIASRGGSSPLAAESNERGSMMVQMFQKLAVTGWHLILVGPPRIAARPDTWTVFSPYDTSPGSTPFLSYRTVSRLLFRIKA